jgi:hypothetical protein
VLLSLYRPDFHHDSSTNEGFIGELHRRDQPFKAHTVSPRGSDYFSYVSNPSDPDIKKIMRRVDEIDRQEGSPVERDQPVIAFPVSLEERKQPAFRNREISFQRPAPLHIPTAHADYLVGKPTAVHDLIHEVRHGRPGAS